MGRSIIFAMDASGVKGLIWSSAVANCEKVHGPSRIMPYKRLRLASKSANFWA